MNGKLGRVARRNRVDLVALAKTDAACRRLVDIPGFGYFTASAMVASIG